MSLAGPVHLFIRLFPLCFSCNMSRMMELEDEKPLKIQLGNWTIWSLNDGYLDLDQRILFEEDSEVLKYELSQAKISCIEEYLVRTQVNAYLIDTGEQLILVDTGCGMLGPTAGFLPKRLQQLNFELDQVSHVLITHLHMDHFGGLVDSEGNAQFSKAILSVPAVDEAFWKDSSNEIKVKELLRPGFALLREALAPYEMNGKLRLIQSNENVLPGVMAIESSGHTPGHMCFQIESSGESLLLLGDLVHTAQLQLKYPEWKVAIDTDPRQGVRSRQKFLEKAADQNLLIGGGHLPYPGLGSVSRSNDHFIWIPFKDD